MYSATSAYIVYPRHILTVFSWASSHVEFKHPGLLTLSGLCQTALQSASGTTARYMDGVQGENRESSIIPECQHSARIHGEKDLAHFTGELVLPPTCLGLDKKHRSALGGPGISGS